MTSSIQPSSVEGKIKAPTSKSMMQRAIAASVLSDGRCTITGSTECEDTKAALSIAESLGYRVVVKGETVTIEPNKKAKDTQFFNFGESGLAARMFTPIISYKRKGRFVVLEGRGTLKSRSMKHLIEMLKTVGVNSASVDGFLPITIEGKIDIPFIVRADGSKGSQHITGLMMVLPLCEKVSILDIKGLVSKPYIDMTIDLMKSFGVDVCKGVPDSYDIFTGQSYKPCDYVVEGDWSGASCLLVAGAIAGSVTITGLDKDSKQGDKAILEAIKMAGGVVKETKKQVCVSKGSLKAFEFDATDCPDLFPALVVLAANCKGVSKIKGVGRLHSKECDRAIVLKKVFSKMGVKIVIKGDDMLVTGSYYFGCTVDAYGDHRIAMACGVAGLRANACVTVKNSECVNKSYPAFWDDLRRLME